MDPAALRVTQLLVFTAAIATARNENSLRM